MFALAGWRNQHLPAGAQGPGARVIPERIITKPPSAELRADQTDQDSLPPYDLLDRSSRGWSSRTSRSASWCAKGYDPATVRKVSDLLDLAEYKRRQAPPGVKITRKRLRPRPPLPDHQRLPQAAPRRGPGAADRSAARDRRRASVDLRAGICYRSSRRAAERTPRRRP